MITFNEDTEVEINIYKWNGEDQVDIEIDYGGFSSLELSTSSMKEADIFIRALKRAVVKVNKYKVNEDGTVDGNGTIDRII